MNTRSEKNKVEQKKINIRSEYINFRDIEESPINAQEMNESDFRRLVLTLKIDGILTSSPLLMNQQDKDKKMCVSGHHRIKAAIKAGITGSICLIMDEVDESTRIRLQIAHNDIHGEPNKDILTILQQSLNEFDINLIDKTDIEEIIKEAREVSIEIPQFRYINVCLIEKSRERFVNMILKLEKADAVNYLIESKEYEQIKDLLTFALNNVFKTAGQAFGKFMDIIDNHNDEIKR